MAATIKNNTAFIIKSINEISNNAPGKKALQKLVYLIQEKGVNLGFDFGLHFYGTYCRELDTEATTLGFDEIVKFDYSDKYSHKMNVSSNFNVEADLPALEIQMILDVIDKFKNKSPYELELLSTALYVHSHIEDKSKNSIIDGVKKIKGEKYTDKEIEDAIDYFDFFNKVIL